MKLKLKKQKITELTSKEMQNIEAGGLKWSNFLSGNCKYSQTYPDNYIDCDDPEKTVTLSCVGKGKSK